MAGIGIGSKFSVSLVVAMLIMGVITACWLFIFPVVTYGFGKYSTINHASKNTLGKWTRFMESNTEVMRELQDQGMDIHDAQQRSLDLKDVIDNPIYQHPDVSRFKNVNMDFINSCFSLVNSHHEIMENAATLSKEISKVKQEMQGAKLHNLLVVPEGVSNRFHHLDTRLIDVAEKQMDLLNKDANMLDTMQANLGIFSKQSKEVVENSAYFKGVKSAFMVQKIQQTQEENAQLQAKLFSKYQRLARLKLKGREQLAQLQESVKQYRELREAYLQEQKERIRDNNQAMKDRMFQQREKLNDSRQRTNDAIERMREMRDSLKENLTR